jgi:hypothetical protein
MANGMGDGQVQEILVLEASPYKFKNDENELVSGMSIKYTVNDERKIGLVSYDDTLPYEALLELRDVPGFYQPREEFRAVRGQNGKMQRVAKIVGLTFVGGVRLVRSDGSDKVAKSENPASVAAGKNGVASEGAASAAGR